MLDPAAVVETESRSYEHTAQFIYSNPIVFNYLYRDGFDRLASVCPGSRKFSEQRIDLLLSLPLEYLSPDELQQQLSAIH